MPRTKNKYTPKIAAKVRREIFYYWLRHPDTTNKDLVKKYDLTPATITSILTEGLQKCKQR